MSKTCLTCKFSRRDSGARECRRNPPYRDERFPLVRDDQWCGEYLVAPLNVVRDDTAQRIAKQAGYRPDVADVPPDDLTPPSGESAIAGPGKPVVSITKKSHAKPPSRKEAKKES